MNLVTCRCGCTYAATNFDTCPDCQSTGAATAITVDKPPKAGKRGKPAQARRKASSSWLTQLHAAGMQDDNAIYEGLRTGAVVQAIGSQANYQHAIDYLESRGYAVAGYRWRIVCGQDT